MPVMTIMEVRIREVFVVGWPASPAEKVRFGAAILKGNENASP